MISSSINEQRLKFPALKNKSYLNFGAQGTMATSTIDAIKHSYDYVQDKGPLSAGMFAWIQEEGWRCKKLIADEFGGEASSYALTQNTTEGCNIVLWGLDWKEGDTLLTTDSEHNGVMKAAIQLCKRNKLKLEVCKIAKLNSEEEILEAVQESLKSKPRLFMISHILWNTGRVLPLKKIVDLCKSKNVKVLADGAQSAGVMPLDMIELGAEFYAFTGHKWIGGPEGVGALYVAPDSLEDLEPTFAGWRGAIFDSKGQAIGWQPDSSRYEVATAPFPLLSGLINAIEVHRQAGTAVARYETIIQIASKLRAELSTMPNLKLLDKTGGSSLVSFAIDDVIHANVVKALESKGFIVRTIPNPECIRASVHYFSQEEADKFCDALKASI
ncbi:MAG: aminotransferase class V-fold PLP-dependent enzyme [Candidatus Obscuribacterales bacterium]|nr:aminotransferase class V-fold PLP-dependent enzyme [Candidatus Obscuribacterales bacterium]